MSESLVVAEIASFGDALRQVRPHALPEMTTQVQGVVAEALNWFVVRAPSLCATHCVGLVNPPVPDILLSLPEITVEHALRPATFRQHVRELHHAIDVCKRPACQAYNALVDERKRQVSGNPQREQSPASINRELLGPLLDDLIYARSWLSEYGTKAGYWAYRFIGHCLQVAAIDSEAERQVLANALIADAANAFHDYFETEQRFYA